MAETHLSLSWNLYNSIMKSGFSTSQQNGDFVDLTIAADGHFIKVHQLILGVASPYIKKLIQSASCQHPVIFLNDVSYSTLCSILEYVYTGEVAIAEENLENFLFVAKSLHIQGLNEMDESQASHLNYGDKILLTLSIMIQAYHTVVATSTLIYGDDDLAWLLLCQKKFSSLTIMGEVCQLEQHLRSCMPDVISSEEINVLSESMDPDKCILKSSSRNINVDILKDESLIHFDEEKKQIRSDVLINAATDLNEIDQSYLWNPQQKNMLGLEKQLENSTDTIYSPNNSKDIEMDASANMPSEKLELGPTHNVTVDNFAKSQELQYTVSSRGFLQLILNRYIYNLFSRSNKGQIRRWRCVDYRDRKCRACVVTHGNVIVKRSNMHIHPFHDKKILSKIEKKNMYSAIKSVENYKEPEK